jgi:hypothetical protein
MFTTVTHGRSARKAVKRVAEEARLASEARIPGAVWADIPLHRSHLPGIPYSYYDEEIVMIRNRTDALIERQLFDKYHGRREPVQQNTNPWVRREKNKKKRTVWVGVSEHNY